MLSVVYFVISDQGRSLNLLLDYLEHIVCLFAHAYLRFRYRKNRNKDALQWCPHRAKPRKAAFLCASGERFCFHIDGQSALTLLFVICIRLLEQTEGRTWSCKMWIRSLKYLKAVSNDSIPFVTASQLSSSSNHCRAGSWLLACNSQRGVFYNKEACRYRIRVCTNNWATPALLARIARTICTFLKRLEYTDILMLQMCSLHYFIICRDETGIAIGTKKRHNFPWQLELASCWSWFSSCCVMQGWHI